MGAHENIVAKDDMPSWTVLASASLLKPRGRNRPRWYVASKYEVIIVFNRNVSYFTICMYVIYKGGSWWMMLVPKEKLLMVSQGSWLMASHGSMVHGSWLLKARGSFLKARGLFGLLRS